MNIVQVHIFKEHLKGGQLRGWLQRSVLDKLKPSWRHGGHVKQIISRIIIIRTFLEWVTEHRVSSATASEGGTELQSVTDMTDISA